MMNPQIDEPERPAVQNAPSQGLFGHTWEMELLISGGVVFTLMQLPPFLEQAFLRLEPYLGGGAEIALFVGYLYGSGILYALIVAFLLHLAARAYWIGLLGLEAVYPHGVRWDNLPNAGPITLRTVRELLPPLRTSIVRTDAFCDVIFAFAFQIVFLFLITIVYTSIVGGIAWIVSTLLGGDWLAEIFFALLIAASLLFSGLAMIDRSRGAHLDPQSRTARGIRSLMRLAYFSQLGSVYGSLSYVLLSNRRRSLWLYTTFFVAVVTLVAVISLLRLQLISLPWTDGLAVAPEREIQPLRYEDQWPDGTISREPSIQSDVISGPYVKLFLPYLPRRHDWIIEERCPDPRTRLDCLPGLYQVKLDGRPVPGLTFHLATHPKSGLRGFQTYIPTQGLARSAHVLRIERLPRPPSRLREKLKIKPQEPFFIRFWM